MTEVSSSLRGVVAAVLVVHGDHVSAGQDVVLIESMKMEYPMAADVDGTVTSVAVTVGAAVDPGDVLLVIGPAAEPVATGESSAAASPPARRRRDLTEVIARHDIGLDAARSEAVTRRHASG